VIVRFADMAKKNVFLLSHVQKNLGSVGRD
jgi:hypothetical protein